MASDDPPALSDRARKLLDQLKGLATARTQAGPIVVELATHEGMSTRAIAREAGIPRSNIRRWAREARDTQEQQ
jgi:DNA-directed RNA polymerase specialized sigma24 family protein